VWNKKDKSKWGGSKNIYKGDITESGGKDTPSLTSHVKVVFL